MHGTTSGLHAHNAAGGRGLHPADLQLPKRYRSGPGIAVLLSYHAGAVLRTMLDLPTFRKERRMTYKSRHSDAESFILPGAGASCDHDLPSRATCCRAATTCKIITSLTDHTHTHNRSIYAHFSMHACTIINEESSIGDLQVSVQAFSSSQGRPNDVGIRVDCA